ncbi:cell division protein ZapA [Laribacter hongkongensis]|uniref:cell division protein ZapA n=1 Tax=Laribacter hongkongensis TaxID=168471 RepID=UPI0003F76643|nr:cell division protein ZapA [Laribacter hongkongensis]
MSDTVTISVELMGRRFSFACPLGEREALMAAARLLDKRMRHIRDSGRIVDAERIAILAALNLTHDLRQGRSSPPVDIEAIERKIQDIENTAQSTISSCSAS